MSVSNLTPLELVTHLLSCMQIADNQIDWEEKEVWADALTELFPDHTPDRAQEILQTAYQIILPLDNYGRNHYNQQTLQNELAPIITELIDADGMVLSAEVDLAVVIENELGIQIEITDD